MREYETPCSDDSKKVCNCIKTAPIASDHNIYLNNEEPNIKEMQPNFTIRKPYDTIYISIYICVCVFVLSSCSFQQALVNCCLRIREK